MEEMRARLVHALPIARSIGLQLDAHDSILRRGVILVPRFEALSNCSELLNPLLSEHQTLRISLAGR
jgi:hypothetical protein